MQPNLNAFILLRRFMFSETESIQRSVFNALFVSCHWHEDCPSVGLAMILSQKSRNVAFDLAIILCFSSFGGVDWGPPSESLGSSNLRM